MKYVSYIGLLLVTSFSMFSCNSWLDVQPKTESSRDELFTSQQGFQDALIGVYLQMMESSAYGGTLTFDMVDKIASLYTTAPGSTDEKLSLHDWTDSGVEGAINSAFSKLYKIISSANSLLEKMETNGDCIADTVERSLIHGEALAIRAMCHFDVLRLFGPVPSQHDNSRILPYVTTFGYKLTEHSTYEDFCQKLLKDLSDAEQLLTVDPIYNQNVGSLSSFFGNRQYRLNYFAVKAIQARVYLWMGDTEKALEAALAVINAENENFEKIYTLGNAANFSSGDNLFTSEHILAIYDFELETKYSASFKNGGLYRGENYNEVKYDLFKGSGVDIRAPEIGPWWTMSLSATGTNYCVCNKYETDDQTSSAVGYRIPLIRLAEMYLIAIETAPLEEAQTYWDEYQRSRNVVPVTLETTNRESLVMEEYRREFYAEGVIFYYYKRTDQPRENILWSNTSFVPNYVLPKPSDELVYDE